MQVVASIVIVCIGVGVSTVSDTQLGSNYVGWAVGVGAIIATAAYQIWAGTKQKELSVGSMQLLEQYAPIAAVMLGLLVPICEPMGWTDKAPGTLLGYTYTTASVRAPRSASPSPPCCCRCQWCFCPFPVWYVKSHLVDSLPPVCPFT